MSDDHPNVSLEDWKAFSKYPSPFVFRKVFERGAGAIRWYVIPRALGVAVASDYLLRMANYRTPKSVGRRGHKTMYFERVGSYDLTIYSLLERQCWMIERHNRLRPTGINERLVVSFGWTPLVTEHFKAALCCGRYATTNRVSGLKWAPTS
jgi:hypothetical protein